jgi:hypothetical protein
MSFSWPLSMSILACWCATASAENMCADAATMCRMCADCCPSNISVSIVWHGGPCTPETTPPKWPSIAQLTASNSTELGYACPWLQAGISCDACVKEKCGAGLPSQSGGTRLQVVGTHFEFNGEPVFLSGANQPWLHYGADFGNNRPTDDDYCTLKNKQVPHTHVPRACFSSTRSHSHAVCHRPHQPPRCHIRSLIHHG